MAARRSGSKPSMRFSCWRMVSQSPSRAQRPRAARARCPCARAPLPTLRQRATKLVEQSAQLVHLHGYSEGSCFAPSPEAGREASLTSPIGPDIMSTMALFRSILDDQWAMPNARRQSGQEINTRPLFKSNDCGATGGEGVRVLTLCELIGRAG